MWKVFMVVGLVLTNYEGAAQKLSVDSISNRDSSKPASFFSAGFIDLQQNGQMNASARLIHLLIGEPGKFQLPLSIYSGVSANNFGGPTVFEDNLSQLVNPAAGVFNMHIDGNHRLGRKNTSFSYCAIDYLLGLRYLSIGSPLYFTKTNFVNNVAGLGANLVTGAWERDKSGNIGRCWISLRLIYSISPAAITDQLFSTGTGRKIWAAGAGLGISLSQVIQARMNAWKLINIEGYEPFIQLTFNYSQH